LEGVWLALGDIGVDAGCNDQDHHVRWEEVRFQ
jgi:hypothetical protein